MRHGIKYVLSIAVVLTGLYAAQQHRANPGTGRQSESWIPPAEAPKVALEPAAGPDGGRDPLAMAVLVDVDRMKLDRGPLSPRAMAADPGLPDAEPDGAPQLTHSPTIRKPAGKPTIKKGKSRPGGATAVAEAATVVPPELPAHYRSRLEPLDDSGTGEFGGEPRMAEEPSSGARGGELTAVPEIGAAQPLVHRIAEGDTLPRLAERYLGDRGCYGEIFAANRDLLADPRLLPVGVEIRVPRGGDKLPSSTLAQSAVGSGGSPTAGDPVAGERGE